MNDTATRVDDLSQSMSHILQVCVSVSVCVSDQCHITPLLPVPDTSTGSLSVSLTQVCDSLVLTPHSGLSLTDTGPGPGT